MDVGDFPRIDTVRIDPSAEAGATGAGRRAAEVSQAEQDFYDRGAAEFHQLQKHKQELGLLGKIFGSGQAAPTNIAGMVVCLFVLAFLASFGIENTPQLEEGRKLMLGVISTSLAYIFGAASKKS